MYSPDFTPCDYHISGPLWEALIGKTFQFNEDVQEVVHEWLRMNQNDFFFTWNPGMSDVLEDMHLTQETLC
jgi:hypothetical protein